MNFMPKCIFRKGILYYIDIHIGDADIESQKLPHTLFDEYLYQPYAGVIGTESYMVCTR